MQNDFCKTFTFIEKDEIRTMLISIFEIQNFTHNIRNLFF